MDKGIFYSGRTQLWFIFTAQHDNTCVIVVTVLSWLANFIAKFVINTIVTRIVKRTTSQWDDIFLEQKVFTRLSHLAPALVIWFMAAWALKAYPGWLIAVHKMAYIYMVVAGMMVLLAFIEAWHQIYNTLAVSQHRHIKGYVQLVKIFVIIIALLVVVSVVFKKDISSYHRRSWGNGCCTDSGFQRYFAGSGRKYSALCRQHAQGW